jgi:hypothetical protein
MWVSLSDIQQGRSRDHEGHILGNRKIVVPSCSSESGEKDPRKSNIEEIQQFVSASRNILLEKLIPEGSLEAAPRVWIIGGGPSLRGFDFSMLKGEIVLGVNRAYELDCITCSVISDPRLKDWIEAGTLGEEALKKWNNLRVVKLFTVLENTPLVSPEQDPVYVCYWNREIDAKPKTGRFSLKDLGYSNNTGLRALQVALALGAKDIRLLGFDMGGGESIQSEQQWFHEGYPKSSRQNNSTYKRMIPKFQEVANQAAALGVSITNYSMGSGLHYFPKKELASVREIVFNKPERPVVVGYYTAGTSYAQEIVEMERSARFFGLDVDIVEVEPRGDWHYNCMLKGHVVREMMEKYQGRPILYLDADSRVRRYPTLFDNYAVDFAYCTFDWDNIPGTGRRGKEVSSAVMYIRRTPATIELINRWCDANERNIRDGQRVFDQVVLSKVLVGARDKERHGHLPMNYNQIFDSMAGLGDPVIEQMQASRRFKREVS